jgi:hypothetical protein
MPQRTTPNPVILPTMRVKRKSDGAEVIINQCDFVEGEHTSLDPKVEPSPAPVEAEKREPQPRTRRLQRPPPQPSEEGGE